MNAEVQGGDPRAFHHERISEEYGNTLRSGVARGPVEKKSDGMAAKMQQVTNRMNEARGEQ